MPCYDKKLEAVRPNFTLHEDLNTSDPVEVKEVDTVLATHELVDLISSQETSFADIKEYSWSEADVNMVMGSPSGWGFLELME